MPQMVAEATARGWAKSADLMILADARRFIRRIVRP